MLHTDQYVYTEVGDDPASHDHSEELLPAALAGNLTWLQEAIAEKIHRSSALAVNGKQPVVGIAIEVEECYLQCAKAVIRSKLWEPAQPLNTRGLSCFAQILIDQTKVDETVESLDRQIQESYARRLY